MKRTLSEEGRRSLKERSARKVAERRAVYEADRGKFVWYTSKHRLTFEEFLEFVKTLDAKALGTTNWNSDLARGQLRELFCSSGYTNKHALCAWFSHRHPCETPGSPDFWLQRGWPEDIARERSSNVQRNNSLKYLEKKRVDPDSYKDNLPFHVGYWTKRGHSYEEAIALVKERQACFSFEKLKKKHGEEKARELLDARNEKWAASLGTTDVPSLKSRGWSRGRYSAVACDLFEPFFDDCRDLRPYLGSKNKELSLVSEDRKFYYDFVVVDLKLIFEYQGVRYHPSPRMTLDERSAWRQPFSLRTADEIDARDSEKKALANRYGYDIVYLWEDEDVFELRERVAREIASRLDLRSRSRLRPIPLSLPA